MRRAIAPFVLLLVAFASGQLWDGPYQLTFDPGADVNPSVCREWVNTGRGNRSALVWQSNRNGSWDVYARIHDGHWLSEQCVAGTVQDECRPAVVCTWDSVLPGLWCVYERADTGGITVMASRCPAGDTLWQPPEPIGGAFCDSACLSAITVPIEYPDTPRVWVAWRTIDQGRWKLVTAIHDGDSWRGPQVAVEDSVELRHPRIGRGWRSGLWWYPLLVWEREGDIMASEFWHGSWTTPVEVGPSDSLDCSPEVVSPDPMFCDLGAWVVWQSRRLGHWSLFAAPGDTLGSGREWSEPGSEANDVQPSGTPANFTTDWDLCWVVYASDRDGGQDIYSCTAWEPAAWVDTNPSIDRNPCLTTLGWTLLWCVWQSDRSGNEDLFGSYYFSSGVEGGRTESEGRAQTRTVYRAPELARLDCRVIDVQGRDVTDRRDRLAPGVYFLHSALGIGHSSLAVTKVIVQR